MMASLEIGIGNQVRIEALKDYKDIGNTEIIFDVKGPGGFIANNLTVDKTVKLINILLGALDIEQRVTPKLETVMTGYEVA